MRGSGRAYGPRNIRERGLRRFARHLLLGGWLGAWGILAWLSWSPTSLPGGISDKTVHFLVYFLMSGVAFSFARSHAGLALAAVATFLLSAVLEFGQSFLPYRRFDYADLLANGGGTLAGWLLASLVLVLVLRSSRRTEISARSS